MSEVPMHGDTEGAVRTLPIEVRVPTRGMSDAGGACNDPTYGGEDSTSRAGPTWERAASGGRATILYEMFLIF